MIYLIVCTALIYAVSGGMVTCTSDDNCADFFTTLTTHLRADDVVLDANDKAVCLTESICSITCHTGDCSFLKAKVGKDFYCDNADVDILPVCEIGTNSEGGIDTRTTKDPGTHGGDTETTPNKGDEGTDTRTTADTGGHHDPPCDATVCADDAEGAFFYAIKKAGIISGDIDGAVCKDDNCEISCKGNADGSVTGDDVCDRALEAARTALANKLESDFTDDDRMIKDGTIACDATSDPPICVLAPPEPATTERDGTGGDTRTTEDKGDDTRTTENKGDDTRTTEDKGDGTDTKTTENKGDDTRTTEDKGDDTDTRTTKDTGVHGGDTKTTQDTGDEGTDTKTTQDDGADVCERKPSLDHKIPCRPDPGNGNGCGLKVQVSLKICVVDRLDAGDVEDSIWRAIKKIVYKTDDLLCDGDLIYIADINIYKDPNVVRRLVGDTDNSSPLDVTDTCPVVTDLCGDTDSDHSEYKILVTVAVRCSDCDRLKEKALALYDKVVDGSLGPDFEKECLANSVVHDTQCGVGLGRIIVDGTITVALYSSEGGEILIQEININQNNASQRGYYVGIVAVLVVLSVFN